jgi:hypothetical protein
MRKITVAELKNDIKVGTIIQCIGREEDRGEGTLLQVVPLKPLMQGARTVTHKDTTGFYMNATPEDGKRGSFLGWPKLSELERDGNNFNILFTRANGSIWAKNYYTITN